MHIDPIHAGPVALAHALVLAVSGRAQRRGFRPLRRLAQWMRKPDATGELTPDATQLMLLSECAGRHYATALAGMMVMERYRKHLSGVGEKCQDPGRSI
jgi:hypothetical protein